MTEKNSFAFAKNKAKNKVKIKNKIVLNVYISFVSFNCPFIILKSD